jgi:hypothetical protein
LFRAVTVELLEVQFIMLAKMISMKAKDNRMMIKA